MYAASHKGKGKWYFAEHSRNVTEILLKAFQNFYMTLTYTMTNDRSGEIDT